jgi:hypothetical protein
VFWRNLLYLLDVVIYFVQQISVVVILGWIIYTTGKTLLKKFLSINPK